MRTKANIVGRTASLRRALTLVELVVVLAILVALSGMIVPLVQGLGYQTNAATNATVVDDVNRALGSHAARSGTQPDGWDSLLNESGSRFSRLHSALAANATPNLLQDSTLTLAQLESLGNAGIYNVYDAVEASGESPNFSNRTLRPLPIPWVSTASSNSAKVLKLTLPDGIKAFGGTLLVNQAGTESSPAYEFVVFGLGSNTTVQGATMVQAPLIQSADPSNHYARVCCIFMVPAGTTKSFPAKYVGCFLPDGTTARTNMENYNNNARTD